MQKSNGFSPLFYYFPLIYITQQYLVPKVLSANKIWGYLFSPAKSSRKILLRHPPAKLFHGILPQHPSTAFFCHIFLRHLSTKEPPATDLQNSPQGPQKRLPQSETAHPLPLEKTPVPEAKSIKNTGPEHKKDIEEIQNPHIEKSQKSLYSLSWR